MLSKFCLLTLFATSAPLFADTLLSGSVYFDSQKTLEEVGERFGVTRERVRQIQNLALIKLRKMIEKIEAVKS